MSLYLGTTEIYGVTTGDAAVSGVELPELTNPATAEDIIIGKEVIDANGIILIGTMSLGNELATQDNLITQIATALEGKTGGSSVAAGSITIEQTETSITISDIIGKDNVALMYMDSCSCPASRMADAGLVNVIIQGEMYSYNVHYYDELYACSDDGFIQYDKTTGKIDTNNNMRYNECFIAGKYMYVAW